MTELKSQINLDEVDSGLTWKMLLTSFLAIIAGIWVTAVIMPIWMPGITASILGKDIKVFWYISRGSALIAYCLLWLSMALGLLMTNRMTKPWPGPVISNEFHQFISILGLAFVLVHAFILMGDQYIHYSFLQILIPFTSIDYRPFMVGLGQISLYLWLVVVISFYIRKKIGNRNWRMLHYFSFLLFLGALVHGIMSGTDSSEPWMQLIYWISGGSIMFLVVYRILMATAGKMTAQVSQKQV
jgi:predicted ferric reductase